MVLQYIIYVIKNIFLSSAWVSNLIFTTALFCKQNSTFPFHTEMLGETNGGIFSPKTCMENQITRTCREK